VTEKKRHPAFLAIRRAMRLDVHDSDRGATHELARLRQLGLLHWRPKKLMWTMEPDHAAGMLDVIRGRAFHDPNGRRNC
jgi:hypothetical protein